MLNLDYPDPTIPGPKPPAKNLDSNAVKPNWGYRAYVWLLASDRPWTAIFWFWLLLLIGISGALGDWRWFVWGAALPLIVACAVFLAVSIVLIFTRFIVRLLM